MSELKDKANQLLKNNEIILDELNRGEPGEGEVFSSQSQDLKVVFENKDFSVSTSHSTSMYGIRYIQNGKMGFITTNSEDENSLKEAAREVQNISRLANASEHQKLAKNITSSEYEELSDAELLSTTPKELCAYTQQLVEEATSDKRVSIDRIEMSLSQASWGISSASGIKKAASQATLSWFAMGMAKTQSEVTSFDYDGGLVIKLSELEAEIKRSMNEFKESVIGSLGVKKAKTYKGLVLLHPNAVMDLLGDFIVANANGLRHQDGMSSWKGKLQQKVVSEMINFYEDPTNRSKPEGWNVFDREGVPTRKHEIISEGKLNFIAHNVFSASREGMEPTGNATGSSRSLPGIGFSNLSFEASSKAKVLSEVEINGLLKSGLVLKRFSGNSDPTSGHFSGVAKNSWWAEEGKRAYPVSEVMVAGQLFEVLQNIVAIGDKNHKLLGGATAPYVLVDGLSVTSA